MTLKRTVAFDTAIQDSREDTPVDEARFERLLQRIETSQIAKRTDLGGCSSVEIEALEARYAVRLPSSYRRYLEIMGHRSGRLFTCDHMAVTYPYVLEMTEEHRASIAEARAECPVDLGSRFELPANSLLIAGRLGEQFGFIRCDGQEDCAISYFNIWDWEIKPMHASILEWLECWCAEAETAIASGYFDTYPNGTTP